MRSEDKRVKDIMAHIEEYEKIDAEAPLCEALQHLKKYDERRKNGEDVGFHKTMLVTDSSGAIVGKLSFYDFIKGLVPERAKEVKLSRKFSSMVSGRALEVADQVGDMQERFKWLHSSFIDLVKQESHKKVKDVMSPIHPILEEEDTINKAIYAMFKENIRQPLVTKGGKIVGVARLIDIFPVLLEIAGDECLLKK